MRKSLLFMIVIVLFSPTLSISAAGEDEARTEKILWLKDHTISLRSIDPKDEDFSDLMPLVKVLGNAEIVQLGENTHGDGAAFLAKGRLIRFLHQVMGFDVLAWEAGFFDCRLLDAALRSDMTVHDTACQALYQLWCNCAEIMPIIEYARATQRTPRPLTIAGFDCRVSTPAAREKRFPEFIFSFFDRLDPKLLSPQDRDDFRLMSLRLVPADYYKYPEKRQFNSEVPKRLLNILDQNKDKFLPLVSEREFQYVRQTLVSFFNMGRALFESGLRTAESRGKNPYTRDTAMAENLLWLYKTYYPGRKIIVWAHNYHIMEDMPAAGLYPELDETFKEQKNIGPHGRFLNRELGDKVYTIGITGYQGTWGYVGEKTEPIPLSEPNSLDDLLHQNDRPFCFLDFRALPPTHWLRQPLPARFSFWETQTAYWTMLYDGVLFIDTMTPATQL